MLIAGLAKFGRFGLGLDLIPEEITTAGTCCVSELTSRRFTARLGKPHRRDLPPDPTVRHSLADLERLPGVKFRDATIDVDPQRLRDRADRRRVGHAMQAQALGGSRVVYARLLPRGTCACTAIFCHRPGLGPVRRAAA